MSNEQSEQTDFQIIFKGCCRVLALISLIPIPMILYPALFLLEGGRTYLFLSIAIGAITWALTVLYFALARRKFAIILYPFALIGFVVVFIYFKRVMT